MRPRTLEEFAGQQELIGPGRALRNAIERDAVPSMILWGPPGSGKTTLAEVIAARTGAYFERISAVSAGVSDLRRVVNESKARRRSGKPTMLFVDEIHRFNKAQQDAVLPAVEDGTVTLIGATTENPSFEVNSALLSRARVFVLEALSDDDVGAIVERALHDAERGLGANPPHLDDDARALLVGLANGDARAALNTLELAAAAAPGEPPHIDAKVVREAMQRRSTRYDQRRRDALRHDQRVHQVDPRERSGRRSLLARAIDRRRRGSALHRAPARDSRLRGRRSGRFARTAGSGCGAAGRALRRHARRLLSARARDALSGDRAEEQQRRHELRRRAGRRAGDAQRAGAAAPAKRVDVVDASNSVMARVITTRTTTTTSPKSTFRRTYCSGVTTFRAIRERSERSASAGR